MAGEQSAPLSASEAAQRIRDGVLTSEELVQACLERIRAVEAKVQAWTFLDEQHALAQARSADERRRSGQPVGALNGLPVGIKDIIDTADMPTENGCALHRGRTPSRDAAVVSMLRAAGAVILGKTVTTECAYFFPGKTRNPHNPEHTPGGSSSGSAAAVAAGMVPLAVGSQTNGSVIRPAAFCGAYGFKPTHGMIPRSGILQLSRTLDREVDERLSPDSVQDLRPRALHPGALAGGQDDDRQRGFCFHVERLYSTIRPSTLCFPRAAARTVRRSGGRRDQRRPRPRAGPHRLARRPRRAPRLSNLPYSLCLFWFRSSLLPKSEFPALLAINRFFPCT